MRSERDERKRQHRQSIHLSIDFDLLELNRFSSLFYDDGEDFFFHRTCISPSSSFASTVLKRQGGVKRRAKEDTPQPPPAGLSQSGAIPKSCSSSSFFILLSSPSPFLPMYLQSIYLSLSLSIYNLTIGISLGIYGDVCIYLSLDHTVVYLSLSVLSKGEKKKKEERR